MKLVEENDAPKPGAAYEFADRVALARDGRPGFAVRGREVARVSDDGSLQFLSMSTMPPETAYEFGVWLTRIYQK